MKMYNEFICEAIPILIGDKEHDREQLGRAMTYLENKGFCEEAEEIRNILNYKY